MASGTPTSLSSTASPAAIYLVRGRLVPSSLSLAGETLVEIQSGLKTIVRPWVHISIYIRGWFFDITSDFAQDTASYVLRRGRSNMKIRARLATEEDARYRYTMVRVGITTQPTWMLHEFGRRITSVMGPYKFLTQNCNRFAEVFMQCALQPGTISRIRDPEPDYMLGDLQHIEEWDAKFWEGLKAGRTKFWFSNLRVEVLVELALVHLHSWSKKMGHSKIVHRMTPPPRRHGWDLRDYFWQEEIHAVRIFVISGIQQRDSATVSTDLWISYTHRYPTSHMLLLPDAEHCRPDSIVMSNPPLILAADEMLFLLIPGRMISDLRMDCEPPAASALLQADGTREYLLSYTEFVEMQGVERAGSFAFKAAPGFDDAGPKMTQGGSRTC